MSLFKRHRAAPPPTHLHWTYTKIPPGGTLFGWIAGPVVAVKTHWFGGSSKPCWIELLEGQSFCPYCDPVKGLIPNCKKPRYTGYTPLITRDGRKAVIAVSETLGPTVEKLHSGTQVDFSRTSGPRDPLRVKLFGQLELKPCPERLPGLMGYDISEWLVKLWADDQLTVLLLQREAALNSSASAEGKTEHTQSSPTSTVPVPSPAPGRAPFVEVPPDLAQPIAATAPIRKGIRDLVDSLAQELGKVPTSAEAVPVVTDPRPVIDAAVDQVHAAEDPKPAKKGRKPKK
jgi:hypothetical protein